MVIQAFKFVFIYPADSSKPMPCLAWNERMVANSRYFVAAVAWLCQLLQRYVKRNELITGELHTFDDYWLYLILLDLLRSELII